MPRSILARRAQVLGPLPTYSTSLWRSLFSSSRLEELKDRLRKEEEESSAPQLEQPIPNGRTFAIETYGCQMNVSDSEVVRAILLKDGWAEVEPLPKDVGSRSAKKRGAQDFPFPDLTLINTCAIRDNAENKIWYLAFYRPRLQNLATWL